MIWHHGFSTHIRFGRTAELILINRWREARQLGIGLAYPLKTGRVRWLFSIGWRVRLLGW